MEERGVELSRLKELCQLNGIEISDEDAKRFDVYRELLKKWGRKINITSILSDDEIDEKHFFDSLLGIKAFELVGLQIHGKRFCDVGSGGGFPGIPLSIVVKDSHFTLVEPRKKRCVFLEEVVRKLKLRNVEVLCSRIEDVNLDFDFLLMRAVEDPRSAIEITKHLLDRGALLCIYRGKETFSQSIEGYFLKEIELEPKGVNFRRKFLFVGKSNNILQ